MDDDATVAALAALAEPTRFDVVRLLASEPEGLTAGEIGRRISVERGVEHKQNRMSPHFRQLVAAGLVTSVKNGRTITYAPVLGEVERVMDAMRRALT